MKAHKTCYKCGLLKHVSLFYSRANKCKDCYDNDAKIHKEVKRLIGYYDMGKPRMCQICNEFYDTLELANLKHHNYSLNPKDYMLLCPSCHFTLDKEMLSRNGFH